MSQEGNEEPRGPEKKVDEEWKTQAAREREELQRSQEGGTGRVESGTGAAPPMPEASFATLVAGLRIQALIALGLVEDPVSGRPRPDRNHAKFAIDTLGVLEEKTRGNLTPEEKSLLDSVLFELRTAFVRM